MTIDNQYYEWYFDRFDFKLDKSCVFPILWVLQGHRESSNLWEKHINSILMGTDLNFHHTTHNHTIYKTSFINQLIDLLTLFVSSYKIRNIGSCVPTLTLPREGNMSSPDLQYLQAK